MSPVRKPAARASFNPWPSYALKPLISLAVPSLRESSQMRPSVSTPSTSINSTRIFFARAATPGGTFAGLDLVTMGATRPLRVFPHRCRGTARRAPLKKFQRPQIVQVHDPKWPPLGIDDDQ